MTGICVKVDSKSPEQHLLRNSGHHQRQQWSHLEGKEQSTHEQ
jgi:hypothetical protein